SRSAASTCTSPTRMRCAPRWFPEPARSPVCTERAESGFLVWSYNRVLGTELKGSAPFWKGRTVLLAGRYELGEELGHGGMGDVRAGRDIRLDRDVAIKLLARPSMANGDARRRFDAEARHAAQLSHPNVVAVFDSGEDDGTAFIVMERLPGGSL